MESNIWSNMPFTKAVVVNPPVPLEKGKVYPFVDMASVNPAARTVQESEHRKFEGSGSRFMPGDTLMARITPCLENGKIARFRPTDGSTPGFGSTEFIVIRGRDGVTDNDFAYYLTRWNEFRQFAVSQMAGTSGRQRVPASSLAHFEVTIPPIPVQRRIAHILGALDDKIELNRRMNRTLERIAAAIFKSWFIDFDPVRAKAEGRDPTLSAEITDLFPDRFEDSELGLIPKGWEVKPIGKAVRCVGGATPSTKNPEFWDGGTHPFVTPKDMSSLQSPVILDSERHITDAGVEKISSKQLPVGTVLLSSRAPIGYLAIANVPVSVNQGIIAMVCDGDLPNVYILHWTKANMDLIKRRAGGTTFAEISKRNFRPIPVLVPPQEVLKAFMSLVKSFHDRITSNMRQNRRLAVLRDTLLPKLLSGEIDVSTFEGLAKELAESGRPVGKPSPEVPTETVIYTIGHSNHSIDKFIGLLRRYGVTAIADVRSTPYSRYHPQFNTKPLAASLKKAGIAYVFLGEELGARPKDPACYNNGSVDFDRLAAREQFQRGIERVLQGSRKYRLALMCAEKEPLDCHRTILVCRHLRERGVSIKHILADGSIEDHRQTEARLLKVVGFEPTLFDSATADAQTLEQAYGRRAEEIAYKRQKEKARHDRG